MAKKKNKRRSEGRLGIKVFDKDDNLKEEYVKERVDGEGTIEKKRKGKNTGFERVDKDE